MRFTALKVCAVAAVVTGVSIGSASACRTSGVTGVAGQVVTGTMSLEQGKTCMYRHFTTKSDAIGNRQFPTTDMSLTSGPSIGSVDITGSRITYKAKPGARGTDSFAYRARVQSGRTYDYRINVQIY